jgi:hypothetical protein
MTTFKTKTGYVELIGQWRDGETPRARGGIARLTARDDAFEALIERYVGSSERLALIDHSHIEIQRRNDAW